MPSVADVVGQIDAHIPLAKAGGWDPVGLQVGDGAAEVGTMAVCHEVTEDVVRSVEEDPVDLLVTYHPLLFRPAQVFVSGASASGRAFRLARTGTAVAVVHTAFDVMAGGAADALADVVVVRDATGFGPNWGSDTAKIVTFVPHDTVKVLVGAMAAAGAGRIGRYRGCSYRSTGFGGFTPDAGASPVVGSVGENNLEPETRIEMVAPAGRVDAVVGALVAAHPYEEPAYDVYEVRANAGFVGRAGTIAATSVRDLAKRLSEALHCTPRVAGSDRTATRAAVVPGSGRSFIPAAAAVADVLVTGDVSHHDARDALGRGLSVIDVGHVPGERPGVARLYALVSQLGLPVNDLTGLDPDPWS